MLEATGTEDQNQVNQSKKELYKHQLLRVEDALRFVARGLWNEENVESASAVKLLADRLAEIQEGVELHYEAGLSEPPGPIY